MGPLFAFVGQRSCIIACDLPAASLHILPMTKVSRQRGNGLTSLMKFVRYGLMALMIGTLAACSGATPTPRGAENVAVNRYLWAASLDVLDFLPVESADPFTGIITTGFGTPPGSARAYRATIRVIDPAMDARSLRVTLQSRNGPVALEVQTAIEDAILSRARQLRIADGLL